MAPLNSTRDLCHCTRVTAITVPPHCGVHTAGPFRSAYDPSGSSTCAVLGSSRATPTPEIPTVLADIGASPHLAVAADAAAALATDAAQASMLALGTWASDRLATVATLDPESYGVMRASLDDVMAAAQGLLDAQMGGLVLGWTNALVLGVQQLMTTVRMAEAGSAGGASIESMMAAQQAMAEALQVRNRGGSSSGGPLAFGSSSSGT